MTQRKYYLDSIEFRIGFSNTIDIPAYVKKRATSNVLHYKIYFDIVLEHIFSFNNERVFCLGEDALF